ncbi:hypothetical protein [Acinetobacter sp. ANC 3832]|uniref:hypothetical protein n=1 Tax=Acinetobacter sp. ANC 3832 TaxID=1977874 RepID=UPI000A34B152|nr:hypothetical protein [Acinetobacter sp. ANC 3832]OTG92829.1 hypothetical protein B9T35_11990 [Acinetobacter sp. ANC 3832]
MNPIETILDLMSDYIKEESWAGACFATSAINYILLNELNTHSKPMLGVVNIDGHIFDHAWLEINDQVYDVAIVLGITTKFFHCLPKEGIRGQEYEFANFRTGQSLDVKTTHGLTNFKKFMKNSPYFNKKIDYWDVVILLGKRIGLTLYKQKLIQKYGNTKWTIV